MSHETNVFMGSFILLLLLQFCTARDTITTIQSLKDGQLLVSRNETIALGFFSPGKSTNRYLGIWYNNVSEQTVVWVANRDKPINDTSGVISFDNTGNLVIHGPDKKIPVWSLLGIQSFFCIRVWFDYGEPGRGMGFRWSGIPEDDTQIHLRYVDTQNEIFLSYVIHNSSIF
ncbi:hypothetical protein ACSBR1_016262 [Camellia fascicularis]